MKKVSFGVISMGVVADVDAPQVKSSVSIMKTDGDYVHLPEGVKYFRNKEDFISESASRLWDLHNKIMEDNREIEEAEKVLASLGDVPISELN